MTMNYRFPERNTQMIRGVLLASVLACAASGLAQATDPKPRHEGTRMLWSEYLVVEVMDPAHPERYNRGVRFTPVAAVLGVALDGKDFLYNPVEHDPVQHHAGLASEFDPFTPPPGFAEAEEGEGFVKIGVGVLKKKGQAYSFWKPYEVLTPAETTVTWGRDTATFTQVSEGTQGYAYSLSAVVRVERKQLTVDWTLRNTGTKPLATENYVHNFFTFHDRPVGPDYVVSFPYDFKATGLGQEQAQKGRSVHFTARIPTAVNINVPSPMGYKEPFALAVEHAGTGQRIDVETSLTVERTAIHASQTYVCPEQFIALKIAPGKDLSWQRSYTFGVIGGDGDGGRPLVLD